MTHKAHVRGEYIPRVSRPHLHPLAQKVVSFRFSEFPSSGQGNTDGHLLGIRGGRGLQWKDGGFGVGRFGCESWVQHWLRQSVSVSEKQRPS